MVNFSYKQFAERHRPHIQPTDATLFVTYRLAGSIPRPLIRYYCARRDWLMDKLREVPEVERPEWSLRVQQFRRNWFIKFEDILHTSNSGPMWMQDNRIAAIVVESLKLLDGDAYQLEAYSIMSNHVHVVIKPFLSAANLLEIRDTNGRPTFLSEFPALAKIMQRLKGRSARECNLLLSRTGQFWEHENFDHVIRPGRFGKTIRYVLNNPVKAGLVKSCQDWRWNYCRAELAERLALQV